MRASFLFVLVVAACDSTSAEKSAPAPSASAATTSFHRHARAEADAGMDPLCATVLQEEKVDASQLRCYPAGKYAWAVRADQMPGGIRQTILFAGTDGARARLESNVTGLEWPPLFGRHGGAFDFDGDGVPELVATIAKDVKTFAPGSRIFVTMKKGAIAPYPTGNYQVNGLVDVDHDGRPDLRVSFDLGQSTKCVPSDEGRVEVDFIAHSLPNGTFSLDDAVASGFAEKHCPAMPTADGMFTLSDLSTTWVSCSRMRGKSTAAVIDELEKACAPNADATKKCTGPCRHLPDAIAVAKFTPPLQLK